MPPHGRWLLLALATSALSNSASAQTEAPSAAQREPPHYETVVSALRLPRPLPDVPSAVLVLPREEIARTPATGTDDLVRLAPAAGTFRRTPALLADPTAQGLSLRAVGPSGVSRALLLVDGVPANDPFGGWIYWRALPRLGLERIEVVPGGTSALYGNFGLGGVVQLVSRPFENAVEADLAGGSLRTGLFAARVAGRRNDLGGAIELDALRSDGYVPVAPAQRGAIDRAGASRHVTGNARGEARWGRTRLDARAGLFLEEQNGGTTFTSAAVRSASYQLGLHRALADRAEGGLTLAFNGSVDRFTQDRARLMPSRAGEALAAQQEVDSHGEGLSLVFASGRRHLGGTHELLAGADLRRVAGDAAETLFPANATPTSVSARSAGGEQRFGGLFVGDVWAPASALELSVALRADAWQNRAGARTSTQVDGTQVRRDFTDASALEWSPRVGLLVRPSAATRVRASAYRAFRAPTLNELYRPFQVGTVLTAANEALGPERLVGAELGFEVLPSAASSLRAAAFTNRLSDPIANVTLAQPLPDGATRQRQNLGRVTGRGVDLAADLRLPWAGLVASAAYTFTQTRVRGAPAQPTLIGRDVAHAPRHRARAALAATIGRVEASVQGRLSSRAFEDDLNQLPMAGYAVLDAFVGVALTARVTAYATVQNLLDERYLVGRAGVDTIGPPRLVLGGLRLR